MLWDTIERVNQLRKAAQNNPDYIQSAKAHAKALHEMEHSEYTAKKRSRGAANKVKRLSDIYQQVEFGANPTGTEH